MEPVEDPGLAKLADSPATASEQIERRRAAMGVLARATVEELRNGLAAAGGGRAAECEIVRAPETGLVMLRGRIGGEGAPFNLGEATVTRAVVRLTNGELGFSYCLGRDKEKARLAAAADALWQGPDTREAIERELLRPVRTRLAEQTALQAAQAAATRVEFFTMVRGED